MDKDTRSVVHDTRKEFDRMLHEQLQEFVIILIKKYHYSFSAKFFNNYRRNFNRKYFLKMEQLKEKSRRREADSLPIEDCNITDDIGGE